MSDSVEGERDRIIGHVRLDPSQDPASPQYVFSPEHERLSALIPSSITSPSITPALPGFIAFFTGMYGLQNINTRDSVVIIAMRQHAKILPRPLTPVEHAVLSRYCQNLQNGQEYFGLLGFIGGLYHGTRTEFWPGQKSIRTILGIKDSPTGGKTVPPSGFVYPNGWGQPVEGSTGGGPAEGVPKAPHLELGEVSRETLRGPVVPRPKPAYNYGWPLRTLRYVYMTEPPPNWIVRWTLWQKSRLDSFPVEARDTVEYKQRLESYKRALKLNETIRTKWYETRAATVQDLNEDLKKLKEVVQGVDAPKNTRFKSVEELEAILKEFEAFDNKWREMRGLPKDGSPLGDAAKATSQAASAEAAAKANTSEAEAAASEASKAAHEAFKAAHHGASPEAHSELHSRPPPGPNPPNGNPRVYEFKFKSSYIGELLRLGGWAFLGKYVIGAMGLVYLTSRSRRMETADERLQEYNYDRIEYAKARLREAAQRRARFPGAQPHPQDQGHRDEGREDQGPSEPLAKFEPADTQSLGGLQTETIDWGDIIPPSAPATASRQPDEQSSLPPIRPGESAWDRARRAREGPQGPAMEEDRWAPQAQQDNVAKTDDMATVSRWERIRQQSSEGYAGEKRIPGENRNNTDSGSGGSFGGFGRRLQEEKQKTKEELQKEFDAQLDKERRGEDGAWK